MYEFEKLALSANPDKKIGTELADIMEVIEDIQNIFGNGLTLEDNIKEIFWQMFIIDSLIGNTDRHNGNWGITVDKKKNVAKFSPIYDCGSCLNPMLEESDLKKLNEVELKNLAINCYSCIKENGKKLNYMTYIRSKKNKECNTAILNVFPKIDIEQIYNFIDNIECMSIVRKDFYKNIIKLRYEIIEKVFKQL